MVADRYGVHNIEIVSLHLTSTDAPYLNDLRWRLERARSRVVNIAVDIKELWEKPALSGTDEERANAIALYTPWLEVARQLESQSIRCDPGRIKATDISPAVAL